jgi:heavy metal sensor kinase
MSIRARLTLSFACLFGLIVLGLAVGSYLTVRNSLIADLTKELQVAVDATSMSAEHELNEHATVPPGERDLQEVLDERRAAALPDIQILVLQGERQVTFKGVAHAPVDLRRVPLQRLQTKTYHDLRIASRDLPLPKFNSHYQIYAAVPTFYIARRLYRLTLISVLLIPLGFSLAAGAGYALAKKLLSPLNELSKTIEAVTSSDLGQRVAIACSSDEISAIGQRFNGLLNRLQQAFDSQQSFMADASHELRTPVTAALAAAQVTTRDPFRTREDCDEALLMVERQMLRVKNIVQQLLLLSQADAASLRVNLQSLYLDDVVAETSRAAQALARLKQQSLITEALPEALIRGDSDLLGQALMILLDNAIKFTPPGGRIDVGVNKRGQEWVCYVSDTGPGIPADGQARIFERFYRAPNIAVKEFSGSGLGLAIAKVIVDRHRGTLKLVESKPGFTRFEISLLALDNEEKDAPLPAQPNSFAVRM